MALSCRWCKVGRLGVSAETADVTATMAQLAVVNRIFTIHILYVYIYILYMYIYIFIYLSSYLYTHTYIYIL